MSAADETIPPRHRAHFAFWLTMPLRYADLDPLGHVNNALLPMMFEQSRCDLVYPRLKTPGREHLDIVIASLRIEYLHEIAYPGAVEVGTAVSRLGTKSMQLAHGVFRSGSDICLGTGQGTIVFFDLKSRSSIPIPPDVRAALEPFRTPSPR